MPEVKSEVKSNALMTSAWLLAVSESFNIAVGEAVVAEYILQPEINFVPGSIGYCNEVLSWRGDFIPVMDISVLLGREPLDAKNVAIVAYQEYEGQNLQYVALKLVTEVTQIEVSDESMCETPENYPEVMEPITDSLFIHQGKLTSVIDIADLCNEGYRDYISATQKYDSDQIESAT